MFHYVLEHLDFFQSRYLQETPVILEEQLHWNKRYSEKCCQRMCLINGGYSIRNIAEKLLVSKTTAAKILRTDLASLKKVQPSRPKKILDLGETHSEEGV